MVKFGIWCSLPELTSLGMHKFGTLEAHDYATGVRELTETLPSAYANTSALALIAEHHGKPGVAALLRNKFPTKPNARSGDMGEILATAYLNEECGYVVGPSRLTERDHQEWAMKGDDVLAARIVNGSDLYIIKGEAKSKVKLSAATVREARQGLARNNEMPSPHSLSQFATRLIGTPNQAIGEAVLDAQISSGLRPHQIGHLMFLFTSSDPSAHVSADLTTYQGSVRQLIITLRVQEHQKFINDSYEGVVAGAP